MVWSVPRCVQLTPSSPWYAAKTLPTRVNRSQWGIVYCVVPSEATGATPAVRRNWEECVPVPLCRDIAYVELTANDARAMSPIRHDPLPPGFAMLVTRHLTSKSPVMGVLTT